MRIKRLTKTAIIPTKGSEEAAGYDLYADINKEIQILPHQTVKIGTGLAMEIPNNYFGAIVARSGLATKEGLRLSGCVGIIDSDYRGEVIVPLHNDSDVERTVHPKDRIAQIIFSPYANFKLEETEDELIETKRGNGGFGSTGAN